VLNYVLGLKENARSRVVTLKDNAGLGMLPSELFMRMLCLERKRTERSGRRFVLMLLDPGRLLKAGTQVVGKLMSAVTQSTRDTDLRGWYEDGAVIGVIFTEIGPAEEKRVVRSLSNKMTDALFEALTIDQMNEIRLSFHLFPEDWSEAEGGEHPVTSTLRLAMAREVNRRKPQLRLKRMIDICGSLAALAIGLPVFLAVALAVKVTSKGPVLFRQVRLGQYGKKFTFLKFRSMYCNSSSAIHEDYVKRFIAGSADTVLATNGNGSQKIYKLTADPRVTAVGRFLRKTSLDEIPQFINVLRGEMSLVGPRPPVMYEFQSYDLWHKRRLLAVKPGITGLWQVDGRSRVKFDDMVRLDIQYARQWSLWLDLKILIQTPRAVLSGLGAC
jgi:lipopolysaccharide/colanic/teichoic acid biosynthesis glycosyltransferase